MLIFTVICLGSFLATVLAGNKPEYGLDLQGGLSVVYRPVNEVPGDVLDQAVGIIRNRVDSLGVAEPEIGRAGSNILVQLPGIDDPQRAFDLIGGTAELRFRPILRANIPAEDATLESLNIDPEKVFATTTVPTLPTTGSPGSTLDAGSSTTATTAATTTTGATATTGATNAAPATTVAGGDPSTTTGAPASTGPTTTLTKEEQRKQLEAQVGIGLKSTPREENLPDATVILPQYDPKTKKVTERFQLGPAAVKGEGVEGAEAKSIAIEQRAGSNGGGWEVALTMKEGETGIDALNRVATACFSQAPDCPTGRVGIELDGRVIFAGSVRAATFERGQIQLSEFSKSDAKDIATSLRYGSLPIALIPQSTQTVSATLGEDSLRIGVTAGIIGLAIVSLLVILYYKWFGVVAVGALLLSSALLWAVIAYLGENNGLTLSLAGITGLIVSIGVSLDSNIVYVEHIKEDVWNGRTPRAAVNRAFKGAWSTIKKADTAALLGAAALYFLTVGAVRGFAFYLGLATILDLLATFFFTAPMCRWLASRPGFDQRPQRYGLPRIETGAA